MSIVEAKCLSDLRINIVGSAKKCHGARCKCRLNSVSCNPGFLDVSGGGPVSRLSRLGFIDIRRIRREHARRPIPRGQPALP